MHSELEKRDSTIRSHQLQDNENQERIKGYEDQLDKKLLEIS